MGKMKQFVVVPQASGDPEILAGKKTSLAHSHADLEGSMVDRGIGQTRNRESILEPGG